MKKAEAFYEINHIVGAKNKLLQWESRHDCFLALSCTLVTVMNMTMTMKITLVPITLVQIKLLLSLVPLLCCRFCW